MHFLPNCMSQKIMNLLLKNASCEELNRCPSTHPIFSFSIEAAAAETIIMHINVLEIKNSSCMVELVRMT